MASAVEKIDQNRTLPRWIDNLSDRFSDISQSQFDFLRETAT
jgi:hypothetical protein